MVFLIDGSWSIGEESFTKVLLFVSSVIGAFDIVGPSGMQVCPGNKSGSVFKQGPEGSLYLQLIRMSLSN